MNSPMLKNALIAADSLKLSANVYPCDIPYVCAGIGRLQVSLQGIPSDSVNLIRSSISYVQEPIEMFANWGGIFVEYSYVQKVFRHDVKFQISIYT